MHDRMKILRRRILRKVHRCGYLKLSESWRDIDAILQQMYITSDGMHTAVPRDNKTGDTEKLSLVLLPPAAVSDYC